MIREGCSIALFDGESVLLVQRAKAPYAGHWTLPGGRIERGEGAEDAIRREVWEELGLIISAPAAVTTHIAGEGQHRMRLSVFTAFLPHCAPVASSEISNWEWVHPEEIGGYRTTPELAKVVGACLARLEEAGP